MSIFEYDEEKHMQQEREENLERGRAEGREEGMTSKLLQNIKSLMKTMDLSEEQARDALEVSDSDREAVRPLL